MICKNKYKYKGDFFNGYKHGRGKAYFPQRGSSYEGMFKYNMKHGSGKYKNKDYVYHGQWRNDVKWGFGIKIKNNDEIY